MPIICVCKFLILHTLAYTGGYCFSIFVTLLSENDISLLFIFAFHCLLERLSIFFRVCLLPVYIFLL